ncbi:hypothetical protein ACF064_33820 [Streptomyces sp. NPDC015492]|uniref:hypothetical protein n=1 Tax=Streptomyces sp. NPDC015492 TaxID=3364958 RepID=UPI0036F8ACF2
MYDDARDAGLACAPVQPGPSTADLQAQDCAKDELRQMLPVQLGDERDSMALDLAHPAAAQGELERLKEIERRCSPAR